MAHVNVSNSFDVPFFDRLKGYVDRLQEARALRRMYKETYAELDALTERELSDIGIGRGEIARIASEHVYGG
ncbi:DUF1127 domain-containing protein [Shimia abyssi]|uniref:Uncharacterized protein YjiS (DUF1127 family) n=1 Tax=Shimia abyssi TaxID=1662395 RepID=A0A2P8F9Z8_9RHOB|nr:DUF1127 domain-containing protein [Shimia abyssi]PSL18539.1 uncharacterized protein YjiS (DUF1127 family) [Shimia abyssi]